jgi:hypothetical protein
MLRRGAGSRLSTRFALLLAVAAAVFLSVPFRASLSPDVLSPDTFTERTKLTAVDGAAQDQFGFSVAVSGDYAIVGTPRDDGSRGSAYIFQRAGSSWVLQQKLAASDAAAEDSFGWSVAISGSTAVIGAYADDVNGTDQGSVYVFVRTGSTWFQQQKLTASDGSASDQLGISVAVSGDTVVAGAFGDDSYRGSAYVFTRSGGSWTQEQKLTASDGSSDDDFGWSVGLSGESVVVGSPRDDASRGSAFIFARSAALWSQQQKLTAPDGAALDQFGFSVAIDGETAVAGAVDDVEGSLSGSAYVFARTGGLWSAPQKLTASDGSANDHFGTSVSISGDTLLVGADGKDSLAGPDTGAAYVFGRAAGSWGELQKLVPSDATAGSAFGASVAIDGPNAVGGAPLSDNAGPDSGSAYLFSNAVVSPTPTPSVTPTPVPLITLTGRVLRPSRQALPNARVTLIKPDGTRLISTTSSFGLFSFTGIPAGSTYTITVPSRRYRFAPLTITPTQDMSDIELLGLE